ncbi:MAG: serine--tRNA ligase [Pseudomonadota bacterium]
MHDIKAIRDNPQAFDTALARRGVEPPSTAILEKDAAARALTVRLEEMQAKRNAASKSIGAAKASGDEETFHRLRAEVEAIKGDISRLEVERDALVAEVEGLLSVLPNLPADDTPDGTNEDDNAEIRHWGEPTPIDGAKEHFDLGEALGQMDFETAAKLSGSRFVLLSGGLARLERALASFMLDTHTIEFGYEEISPPVLVREETMYGTGQLPKFAEDSFETVNNMWLTPTSEVTLTSIVGNEILNDEALPKRFTAWTNCFRREAGSAGRDTRGMIRVHQFSKVELVSITRPDESNAEHERMTECAEAVLKKLELPFRTMTLCTGDIGFGAKKTYDLEVWLPGQGKYREISSCSNCGDFQARRMKARYRPEGEKSTRFVHTLNGSGVAVGRALVAVLENYQNPDGSISIPTVLKPYMGGRERVEKVS